LETIQNWAEKEKTDIVKLLAFLGHRLTYLSEKSLQLFLKALQMESLSHSTKVFQ
jgi:hypothetical protein